jgi:hypothetical protein
VDDAIGKGGAVVAGIDHNRALAGWINNEISVGLRRSEWKRDDLYGFGNSHINYSKNTYRE